MTEQNIQTGEPDEPLVCYPSDTVTAARAEIYAQFSVAFSYPEADVLLRISNGELEQEIRDATASLAPSVNVDIENTPPANIEDPAELKTIYSSLFDVTGGTPAVSLLERRYVEEPEQKLWEKLLRFYGHFGLDFSQGSSQEQPDHLLTELSFMHYLGFLEAGAKAEPASYQRGQRDFLETHLSLWLDELSSKIEALEHAEPYLSLSRMLASFVRADIIFLNKIIDDSEAQEK